MLKLVRSNRSFILLLPVILLFLLLSAEESIPYQREVQIYRNKGLEFQRQGRLDEAMVCFQKAITLNPDFVVAYNDLGIIYEAKGWLDKAEQVYLAGLAIDPGYPNFYSNLAMLYEQKQDYKRAASLWKKRIELGIPDDVWTEKAKERLDILRRTIPEFKEEYLREEIKELSREVSLKNRMKKLKELADEKKELSPSQKQAKSYHNRGIEFQRRGRLEEAMASYQKAIVLDPHLVPAYNDLGIIYEAKGLPDRAEQAYLAGLAIDPGYPNFYSNLAMLYEQKKDYKRAASFWKKRIELGIPGDVWTEEAIGRLGALRRTSPALREEYVQEEARQLARELSLKKRIERLKDIEEADRLYEQAKTLYQNGNYEKALNIIGLALSFNPENKDEFLRLKSEINYRLIEQKERLTLP